MPLLTPHNRRIDCRSGCNMSSSSGCNNSLFHGGRSERANIWCYNSGYQWAVGHQGAIIIASTTWSLFNFMSTLPIRLKGGNKQGLVSNQLREKASTATAPGSGFHYAYSATWWFSREANKSIPGTKLDWLIHWNTVGFSFRSKLCWWPRERLSARVLSFPGIWKASNDTRTINALLPNLRCYWV